MNLENKIKKCNFICKYKNDNGDQCGEKFNLVKGIIFSTCL